MMKAYLAGFFPFALGGLIVLLLGQTVLSERLDAASPPNPFTRQQQNPRRTASPAMQFFSSAGSRRQATVPRQRLRRRMPAPQPLQLGGTKPFEAIQRAPTISPYLSLNLRESSVGLPNYYAFVKPLQKQQNENRAVAANLRKLKQNMRTATATGVVSNNPTGGVPTTGHSSQFLNLGGYFSGGP